MTTGLPDIGPDPLSPSVWASKVAPYEPHGLDLLEAHVVAHRSAAAEWTRTPLLRKIWDGFVGFVPWMASIGGGRDTAGRCPCDPSGQDG